ncbi:uncharacterized protein HD556DRAFT_1370855 [Suillus plorans]|uniref:Uncharacterized protein n=1 Tax=Suillus plorans TaxID=116603 RepID=A0A9P7ASB5_9AGAM|nr:uncharacterized protein HD556DRAFT_1370855 [Suillus plorans]KAG1794094.1 hypothetical protein HD556DRAFT_1370855 [Suillus plorans]
MSNPMDSPDAENKDSTGKELPHNTATQSTTRKEPQSRSSMWPLPSISVTRHPSGKFSPQTDERCFSYCSQTTRGRTEGREPTCRSVCFRRVFAHEVRTAIAHDDALKEKAAQKEYGYPLPPEGQPNVDNLSTPKSDDIRYWEEGWYLWTSRSRWATQERLDLMMWDLDHQDHWQRHKDEVQKQWDDYWAEHQRQSGEQFHSTPTDGDNIQLEGTPYPVDGQLFPKQEARHPWQESTLVKLPPPLTPLLEPIHDLLSPSFKVLTTLQRSFESGAHAELAVRMWEKARTPDPFVLASTVCRKMWEKWKEGPPDSDTTSDL